MSIRLLVAGPHPAMCEAIRATFFGTEIEIVAEAGTGEEAFRLATANEIDVVLLDAAMPDGTGYQALRRIKAVRPALPVVILADQDERESVIRSFALGASSHVVKSKGPRRLMESVQEVAFRTMPAEKIARGGRR